MATSSSEPKLEDTSEHADDLETSRLLNTTGDTHNTGDIQSLLSSASSESNELLDGKPARALKLIYNTYLGISILEQIT